ncbi:MAG: HDOD domain-containing protein [Methylomarinum sp.]|nr:HDOD domain-containing protein [Methylomarinum sp.]
MATSTTKINNPQSLSEWTRVLCEQEMPIFSNTAQSIHSTLEDKKKGAMDLASIILQDPNLTGKLLTVSNSVYYNPSNQKMNTVSRAIVILGSNVIRELTLACSFFESILSPENKQRANEEIAFAIHAAVQAKQIAIACKDPSPEEIFIAALLNNIGNIAFWCFGGKPCKYITELVQSGNFTLREAENKVLGFDLIELSKGISKSWKLGGLIENAISPPPSPSPRIQSILLGKEVTHAINIGWNSKEMKSCLKKIELLTGKSQVKIKPTLKNNTELAIQIACKFGAHDASQFIAPETPHSESSLTQTDTPPNIDYKQIQFNILQDITNHISGKINLNTLFEMTVEGIHRGIAMDRTLFCLFSANQKTLLEKLAIGWFKEPNTPKIKFEVSDFPPNLFFKALQSSNGIWAKPSTDEGFYTPHVVNSIGKTECFLIPIHADNKPIGSIYCDRSVSKKPITEDDFNTARHFSQQAVIGMALYKIKK